MRGGGTRGRGAGRIGDRERDAILQSLRAGVVPRVGIEHIQVGRRVELAAVTEDLERVAGGGSAVRFLIGPFGAGKSFFCSLVQSVALGRDFVVARADITTDRRFHGHGGQARAMAAELMKNLAIAARPEGAAMPEILERWISGCGGPRHATAAKHDRRLASSLAPLRDLVGGFVFAQMLVRYARARLDGDEGGKEAALRWLRAEYESSIEARRHLGVGQIIDDLALYDALKLWARFARIAGYAGLVVAFDELVVLSHRLAHRAARDANYEQILRMLNDCLQGHVQGLMLLFCGTDEALEDRRRGLFSYPALATRLMPNAFVPAGQVDRSSPVLRLASLGPSDLCALLRRIRDVHASDPSVAVDLPDAAIDAFVGHCADRFGAETLQTPRELVTRFMGLLEVLHHDQTLHWRTLLQRDGTDGGPSSRAPPLGPLFEGRTGELATFVL